MKKRILLLSLALTVVVSMVTMGCPPVVDPEVVPPPVPVEVIEWLSQSPDPAGAITYVLSGRVARAIEKATDGRLVINVHPGGAIVPVDEEFIPMHEGLLQWYIQSPVWLLAWLPQAPLFSGMIVGGPTAMELFFWHQVGPGMDLWEEMLEGWNITCYAVIGITPEIFLYSNVPLNTVEDLDGLKLRLLGDEAVIFGELGVAAVALPSPEIYEAMARGVIDGFQHLCLVGDLPFAFYEVVRYAYVSPVRQPCENWAFLVNSDAWADLPADIRTIVEHISWSYGLRQYAELTYATHAAMAHWIAAGVEVKPVATCIEEAVKREAMEFYAVRAAECPFYARVFESLMEWRDKYRAAFPRL